MTIRTNALVITTSVAACAGVGFLFLNQPAAIATPVTTGQGMVTVIDSDSGTLRAPTAAEAARYASSNRAPATDAVVLRRADGSESIKLDDSHMIFTTVTRNADGTWAEHCGLEHDHTAHTPATKAVK